MGLHGRHGSSASEQGAAPALAHNRHCTGASTCPASWQPYLDEAHTQGPHSIRLMTAICNPRQNRSGSTTVLRLLEGSRRQALGPHGLATLAQCVPFPCCRAVPDVAAAKVAQGSVRLVYDSQEQFEQITGQLKMLREWKDGECHPLRVAGCSTHGGCPLPVAAHRSASLIILSIACNSTAAAYRTMSARQKKNLSAGSHAERLARSMQWLALSCHLVCRHAGCCLRPMTNSEFLRCLSLNSSAEHVTGCHHHATAGLDGMGGLLPILELHSVTAVRTSAPACMQACPRAADLAGVWCKQ